MTRQITTVAELRAALAEATALLEQARSGYGDLADRYRFPTSDPVEADAWLLLWDELGDAVRVSNRCRVLARAERAT